ncbi:Copia protein, partial [Mucuna pruriens]
MAKTQYNAKVKVIRIDNGPELLPRSYAPEGIIHHTSCRKRQDLLNIGRELLFHSNLPKAFWSYAINHVAFIINRVPFPTLNNQSPYHLYRYSPNLQDFNVFGSLCFTSTLPNNRTKLDPYARKSLFLGYKLGIKVVPRRSTQIKHQSSRLAGYICNSLIGFTSHSTSSGLVTLYLLSNNVSFTNISHSQFRFVMFVYYKTKPKSYGDAKLDALEQMVLGKLLTLLLMSNPLGINRYTKLTIKQMGPLKDSRPDWWQKFDTFSPVAKLTIVRMILALALIHNWYLHQLDVNNAFPHGDLNEDVYMTIPQGVSCIDGNHACKLLKSLYDFEQANHKWYEN